MSAARRWVAVAAIVMVAGCGTSADGATTSSAEVSTSSSPTTPSTATSSLGSDAACLTERATIETANEAHKVMHEAYAESIAALVSADLLQEDFQPSYEWTYTSDGETFTLAGPC